MERFTTLVDPGVPIPLFITRLVGITDADVRGAPTFRDAFAALREFAGDAVLAGHNVGFDREHLAAGARRAGLPAAAPTPGSTRSRPPLLLYPELDRHALAVLAEELGIERQAHRALPDAETAADVLARLCAGPSGLGAEERALLTAVGWAPLALLDRFRAPPDEAPPPVVADESARPASAGRPAGGRRTAGAPSSADARTRTSRRPERTVTRPGRAPARLSPPARAGAARGRRGRRLRAAAAWASSRPAPAWARASPTCCRRPSPAPPPAAASSSAPRPRPCSASWPRTSCRSSPTRCPTAGAGRCSWAARTTSAGGGSTRPSPPRTRRCPTATGALALAYLVGRARRGEVDLSALPYRASLELPALPELARELRSSRATCLGRHCPSRRRCHWRLARGRAEAAHLVCVNHALLLTGPETLPPFEDVVIDEAHLLYHEATEAFSEEVDAVTLDLLLADLRGRRRQRPLPQRLRAAARGAGHARAASAGGGRRRLRAGRRDAPDRWSRAVGETLARLGVAAGRDDDARTAGAADRAGPAASAQTPEYNLSTVDHAGSPRAPGLGPVRHGHRPARRGPRGTGGRAWRRSPRRCPKSTATTPPRSRSRRTRPPRRAARRAARERRRGRRGVGRGRAGRAPDRGGQEARDGRDAPVTSDLRRRAGR